MTLSLKNILKTVVPLGLGVYLVWYFFASMSPESKQFFYEAIRRANYGWIFLSLMLSFLAFALRAYRWKYVLEPLGYQTKFWNRYHALMIGYLMNLTIPRAGEATRSAMLYRSEGVPFTKSFGTIIGERAVDLVLLGSIALLTAWLGYEDFQGIFAQIKTQFAGGKDKQFSWVLPTIGLLLLTTVILLWFLKRSVFFKILRFGKDVLAGVFSVFKSQNPVAYLIQSLGIWCLYILYFAIPFWSLPETSSFPLDGILLAFIAGSLGITFTNGGIGTFPLLVGLVVVWFLGDETNNAQAVGNALGMLIWASQTLLVIVLGLISLLVVPKNFSKEDVQN